MKKLSIKILIFIIALLALTLVEYVMKSDDDITETISVCVAKEEIRVGMQVMDYMVTHVEIPKHLASDYIVKDQVQGYALTDLQPGQFIYSHQIDEKNPITLKNDERMITIKCSVVEGDGWLFKINDLVDVVMILKDNKIILEDARVCRIFNEAYESNLPEYISLVVSEQSAYDYFENVSKSQVFVCKKH